MGLSYRGVDLSANWRVKEGEPLGTVADYSFRLTGSGELSSLDFLNSVLLFFFCNYPLYGTEFSVYCSTRT